MKGGRIIDVIELMSIAGSGCLDIWVSVISVWKITFAGLTASNRNVSDYSDISEKLEFWWSIPQKGTSIGHFDARNDPTISFRDFFLSNRAVDVDEASEVAEVTEVIEAAEVLRPEISLMSNEYFRVIQVLDFSFILMSWTVNFGL